MRLQEDEVLQNLVLTDVLYLQRITTFKADQLVRARLIVIVLARHHLDPVVLLREAPLDLAVCVDSEA